MWGEVCCCCCCCCRERELMNDLVYKQETRISTISSTRNKPFYNKKFSFGMVVLPALFCRAMMLFENVVVKKLPRKNGNGGAHLCRHFYRVLDLHVFFHHTVLPPICLLKFWIKPFRKLREPRTILNAIAKQTNQNFFYNLQRWLIPFF